MHALNPGVVGAVRAAIEARLAAPGTNRRRPAPAAEWGLAMPGDQPGRRGKPQPVAWPVADLAGLAAQHCVLMPEDQELGVIGHLTPGPNHQAAEHTAHEEVDDREEHSATFPARRPARSINRSSPGGVCDGTLWSVVTPPSACWLPARSAWPCEQGRTPGGGCLRTRPGGMLAGRAYGAVIGPVIVAAWGCWGI